MLSKAERKIICSLKQKKFRNQENLFVVEGVKMVQEALDSAYRVRVVYAQEEGLFSGVKNVIMVTEREMSEVSHFSTPSPALALVETHRTDLLYPIDNFDESQLYLALDSIRDPGNLGTIVRIADWFGVKAIFASADTVDLYNPKAVQASMGALFRVPVYYSDLCELIDTLNIPIYGAAMSGESVYELPLSNNGVIIIGNEANGISDALLKKAGNVLLIPSFLNSPQRSESLNAAIATAIICSEFRRRNTTQTKVRKTYRRSKFNRRISPRELYI